MKRFIILTIILACQAADCVADTVTLKNKQAINGVIAQETENHIVLNVGCGTITISRADIESIKKSDELTNALMTKKWRSQYFESFPAPTAEDQKFLDDFTELRYEKDQLTRSTMRKDRIAKDISMIQSKISKLQTKQDDIGKELKSVNPEENVKKYNALVIELNLLTSELRKAVNTLSKLQEDRKKVNEQGVEYINRFRHFKERLEDRKADLARADAACEQENFYQNLSEGMDELQKEIKCHEAGFTRQGEGVIITVTLNNKVDTTMLVDTGATLTVISEETAMRLGLDFDSYKQNLELILADGRHIPAKFVMLDSVRVGNAEAKSVEAAAAKLPKGVNGFLGMSFLKNFSFSIDAEKQKLLFSSVE